MDTVLIVDDSSFIVEGLISFLKKKFRPLAAYGGAECLEILKKETPSVIILDIMMEPMDGWETLALIKENPRTRNIPVLMFSAKKISPEEAEEHRIRLDDFITKPISPKKIIEAIEKVLARRDSNREVVERWKSAGMSQEKIDEYLSLVTSLEVDLSLCQNMKIQNEITHPQDKDLDEFTAVITAIEDRIRKERELIDSLAREMNDALVHGNGSRGESGGGGPEMADVPAGHAEAGSSTGSDKPPAFPGDDSIPNPSQPGPEVPAPGSPGEEGRDPVDIPATGSPPVYLSEPVRTDEDTPVTYHEPEAPLPGLGGTEIPASQDPAHADDVLPGPAEVSIPPAAGTGSQDIAGPGMTGSGTVVAEETKNGSCPSFRPPRSIPDPFRSRCHRC